MMSQYKKLIRKSDSFVFPSNHEWIFRTRPRDCYKHNRLQFRSNNKLVTIPADKVIYYFNEIKALDNRDVFTGLTGTDYFKVDQCINNMVYIIIDDFGIKPIACVSKIISVNWSSECHCRYYFFNEMDAQIFVHLLDRIKT